MCVRELVLSIFLYGFCSMNGAAEADAGNKNNRKKHHRKMRTKEKCAKMFDCRRSAARCIHAKLATTITHISLSLTVVAMMAVAATASAAVANRLSHGNDLFSFYLV